MAQCQELGLQKVEDITEDLANPALKAIAKVLELFSQLKNSGDSSILLNMSFWDHLLMIVTYLFDF